jgi:hypothetical protein
VPRGSAQQVNIQGRRNRWIESPLFHPLSWSVAQA